MNNQVKVFTEIGFGNDTFVNTETEYPDGSEERQKGVVKMNLKAIYFRIWLGNKVFILASNEGFKLTQKSKKRFKVLFVLEGYKL